MPTSISVAKSGLAPSNNALVKSANLADLTDLVAARNNLGVEPPGAAASEIGAHIATTNHPLASQTTKGMMASTDKIKLDGVEALATVNASNDELRDRVTHTGVQNISTVSGLQVALDSKEQAIAVLPLEKGGTGSSLQNYVDLSTDQLIAGNKRLTGNASIQGILYSQQLAAPVIGTATAVAGTSLAAGNYYYKVVAVDAFGGTSLPSSEVTATINGTTQKGITITWSAVAGVSFYRVYRGIASNTQSGYINFSISTTSYTDSGGTALFTNAIPTINTSALAKIAEGSLSTNSLAVGANYNSGIKADFAVNTVRIVGAVSSTIALGFWAASSSTFNTFKSAILHENTTAWGIGKLHLANNIATGSTSASVSDAVLTIDASKNLGINTTTPGAKLQVAGGVAITSSSAAATDPGAGNLRASGNINGASYSIAALQAAPASANSSGTTGEIRWNSGHIYLCIATNTWVRATLSSF